ncbi:hypothetical protein [Symbioplanes lichenis]|uniref:hypothetical protein n=1 Tax=Symbioplanes lichenis TaxID=1629072 RepID=UPI00273A3C77|nr:hypothetical protein [Actinoplanes lichenis]
MKRLEEMPEQDVVASLRRAYPRGHAAILKAAGDVSGLGDIEVHAGRLRLVPRDGGPARDVPFDIADITPRGGTFDLLLDHDRQTVLTEAVHPGQGEEADPLRPWYHLVEGAVEPAAGAQVLGSRRTREVLDQVLGRPGLSVVHAPVRAAARAAERSRGSDPAVLRHLRQAVWELRRCDLDPALTAELAGLAELAHRLRGGARPVLALRRVPRATILAGLGRDDAESLRRVFTDPVVLARLNPAHAIDAAAVPGLARDDLLRLAGELREYEFLAVFLTDGKRPGATSLVPAGLDDTAQLVRSLSRSSAFLFTREQARRMDLAVPEYLPQTQSGRMAGFFPGLGSRAAHRDLGRTLLDAGLEEVSAVYAEAARALGLDRPEQLLPEPENLPASRMARQGFLGAAMLAHGLALDACLRAQAAREGVPLRFAAYTGESFGIITAAVAGGALSVADGARIARAFTPLLLQAAEGITDGGAFERDIASFLPEAVRGRPLVPEPHHVLGLAADPEHLGALLDDIEAVYPRADVEVHKTYSPRQVNVYVRAGVRESFDVFVRKFPSVRVEELKPPTTFLAHARRMRPAREALESFLDAHGIEFRRPRVPIVSNSGGGLLTTAAEVRAGVLAITDEVMASRETVQTLADLRPDLIVELGPGGRSLRLLADNDVDLPLLAWTGAPEEADLLLATARLVHEVVAELEKLYSTGDRLTERHHDLLRELFRLAGRAEFAERSLVRTVGRVITNEMLHPHRDGAPAFYRFLEVFQHTRQHLGEVDAGAGELVLHARMKKDMTGGAGAAPVYAELTVVDAAGAVTDRRTTDVPQPEALVFHFDRLAGVGFADLARQTRTLLDGQPLARQIYDHELGRLGIEDDSFLTVPGAAAPTPDQLAVAYVLYQYVLFHVLRLHRPAIFAHDFYVEGSDPMGWLVALAVADAVAVPDAVALYRSYLRGEGPGPDLDRVLTGLRRPGRPVISPDGVPLQSTKDLEAATRDVLTR